MLTELHGKYSGPSVLQMVMSLLAKACTCSAVSGDRLTATGACQAAQPSSVLVCDMQGSMASFLHLQMELQVAIFDMLDITER